MAAKKSVRKSGAAAKATRGGRPKAAPKGKSKITAKARTARTTKIATTRRATKGATRGLVKAVKQPGMLARQRVGKYDPKKIEPKWQKKWEADQLYRAVVDPNRKKFYALTMLPYTSGNLHIGHWYAMAPSDARARWMRMRGFNVMFPIGFDAFGLPAENAAIERGIHPKKWTYKNIVNMRKQLRSMGAMWDWGREAVSADPEYYRWTQWFFSQLFKHGLAYKKMSPVDWCPNCQTTLAREQVWGEDRHCERCGTPVIKKNLEQWYFRTTKYAEELLRFDGIDWPERVREMQANWIGRSEGAEVTFRTEMGDPIAVFTTRPDTLWGATFMVLAPEHPLVQKLTTPDCKAEVEAYVAQTTRMTDIDRESIEKEKTGVFVGAYAINPVNNARTPIWIADYVLMTYGTGAIMAVPAHDARDFAFATKYSLPIPVVIAPPDWDGQPLKQAYSGPGQMVNSGEFDGTPVPEGVSKVIRWLEQKGIGKSAVTYRLRDWLISRQRYWGAPIPIVYCPEHGMVPVPDERLPVMLPEDVEWLPTGQSPLKLHPTWAHTTCPECGKPALRDTDTMDTFMCSSWYHLRYLSPHYDLGPFDPEEYNYWMPVDTYTGGAEHATMHLIYTRFFHKALRDMGIAEGHEPMMRLRNQGQILGPDGQRMSKSRGNVVDPDEQVKLYGADTVRAYLMFGYQWSEGGPWSTKNIQGVVRWLNRVWAIAGKDGRRKAEGGKPKPTHPSGITPHEAEGRALRRITHQTIARVAEDFEQFEFNTIVSALMEMTNALYKYREMTRDTPAWDEAVKTMLLLMAPVTPHIAEELWAQRGQPYSIHQQVWPAWDPAIAAEEMLTIVVQVNGKVRDRFDAPAAITEAEAKQKALATEGARRNMDGKEPKKVLYVPGRLVNIVV
ncbi:MAG TPA: leucine--tRNA ligase [Anaerolineales bacterium]|nr:leucine--tRNA ligase [Anaerolineales bacterium]